MGLRLFGSRIRSLKVSWLTTGRSGALRGTSPKKSSPSSTMNFGELLTSVARTARAGSPRLITAVRAVTSIARGVPGPPAAA